MQYKSKPYQCEAYKITAVFNKGQGQIRITLDDDTDVTLNEGQTSRMIPVVGDYYVVATNPDGKPYEYLNPKAVFESKYEPVE